MKKNIVIIAARGIGDLIYHLPLLRSLYENYKQKLIIISNKVNHSKDVYKFEEFYEEIIEFENTRFSIFKTLQKIVTFKNLINKYNADQLILTASPRRLMAPVYFSNAKKKIIFGEGKFLFTKDKKYQNFTHAEKMIKYTENLNLPILKKNFFLNRPNFKMNKQLREFKIFINIDSHHDQNNWNIKNYIKLIKVFLSYNLKVFINFSPKKLYFLNQLPIDIKTSKKIVFTYQNTILEIMEKVYNSNMIIGNESGPICLGASYKKEVHSIYLPIHTRPESEMINEKTFYYNTDKESDEIIINKIINNLLRKIS